MVPEARRGLTHALRLFGSAQARRGGPDVDSGAGFREFVEHNVEAQALGFESIFVVEHHFTGFGWISATLNLLTMGGARNTTLRLGTAVITSSEVLDVDHPGSASYCGVREQGPEDAVPVGRQGSGLREFER